MGKQVFSKGRRVQGLHTMHEDRPVARYSRVPKVVYASLALMLVVGSDMAQTKPDPLKNGFENPPETARPRVWWHWMNGNITREGIKLDIEWMHRVGIAGVQIFDAALSTPQVVRKRLVYMSPEWKDAFKYATVLADQMGLEQAIAGSPGWSESGGPWVPASQAMKKYVWSETRVEGGKPFRGTLAHPPSNTGAFQNLGIEDEGALGTLGMQFKAPQFYADSAVIAYQVPASDVPIENLHPKITSSCGAIDTTILSDGDLVKTTTLPKPPEGQKAWIQYEFPQPQTVCALTIVVGRNGPFEGFSPRSENSERALEVSDDGQTYRVVASIPTGGSTEHTISFEAVTAKFFRVTFKTVPVPRFHAVFDPESADVTPPKPATEYEIAELVLHSGARVNRFEEKAAFNAMPDLYQFATPTAAPVDVISKSHVIDLTSKLQANGTLNWTPPAGHWAILRFGYSLLGITNEPATLEATGLEVGKLNHTYVRNYLNRYLDSYKQTVGSAYMGRRGIRYLVSDSWEAGAQNWTDDMIAKFRRLRGYDPVPWMAVLAGHVVGNARASDQFLWDFRKTIADLTANEYYGQLEATLQAWHMGHYGESHEYGRAFVTDGMEVKKFNEVPMGAMWTQRPGMNEELYDFDADDRESASVAHIYGQNVVAAESLTAAAAPWAWSPATLKPTADQELLNGINRFVISESVHQPLVGKAPGLTLGPYGQWFNRNETWAEQAGPWLDYLARCSFLLQQGHFSADLVYFYGEDSNLTAIFNNKAPDLPAGYGFDYINADALIHMLTVSNGRITTRSGMSYRVLGLDPYSRHMSLPVLRAIHQLVEDGAVVAGPKPTDDPSLSDDPVEFQRLNDELFGTGMGVYHVGKGIVYAGHNLAEVFHALKLAPDFDYTKPERDTRLLFVHRTLADGDLYFVDNRSSRNEKLDATFRVTGRAPELWHPEADISEPVSYKTTDGRTTVPLRLEPWGTVIVVFRQATKSASLTLPKLQETLLATIDGTWNVGFQSGRGAPASIALDRLISWSESTNTGVKYFSGTGTYTKTIQAPAEWFKNGSTLWIDLGEVKNLAEVTVDEKLLGIVWHAPYRVDATRALKPGANNVTIRWSMPG